MKNIVNLTQKSQSVADRCLFKSTYLPLKKDPELYDHFMELAQNFSNSISIKNLSNFRPNAIIENHKKSIADE